MTFAMDHDGTRGQRASVGGPIGDRHRQRLVEWIASAGLSGRREIDLLQGFCERAGAAGLPLCRAVIGVDTLHPVLEGRMFEWQRDHASPRQAEYGRLDPDSSDDKWRQSPFHQLYEGGETMLRRRLGNEASEFPILEELRQQGITDYVAIVTRFGLDGAIGMMDCTYSSWATDRPAGFSDDEVAALEFLVPCLALAIKGASVTRIAETLVTYLGHDPGHRVLRGHIERGVAEKIGAVVWFSDLQGFTRITDTAPPERIIRLLNDYADAIVSAIHAQRGEVLKFIGDGILAIFRSPGGAEEACRGALDAAMDASGRVTVLNQRREAAGLPVTRFYLGLHAGKVFYGNVGSIERLDFTVVGPAVNEASRIAAMCRSLDQDVLLSSAFANAAGTGRDRLVSVGRYALRGVRRPQELFTLDPGSG
ncbi:MAG: adenylate/guanylate cyclase domain-containing protein [Geminicoccaceae bacterium]